MAGTLDAAENQQPTLKRLLSLTLVIIYGLGNIIGAGIYVLLGKVVLHAGMFAPLAFLHQFVTGRKPVIITLIGLFAVINGALIQIIMTSRVCYGMAHQHLLPAVFARVHTLTRTPAVATLLVSVVVLVLALWFPVESLAKATSYFLLLVFCLVNLSLWRLKRTAMQPAGIFCVPRWVPATGFIASCAFVIVQVTLDLRG